MSRSTPWKSNECAVLAGLVREGLPASQIAAQMGRSRQSIYFKAHQMGLPLVRASRSGGWAARAANLHCGGWCARWGADEVAQLLALVAQHGADNATVIAKIMGRERQTVVQKILRLQCRPAAPRPAKTRPCLCCGARFTSEGAHHRMCAHCRDGNGLPDMWQGTA